MYRHVKESNVSYAHMVEDSEKKTLCGKRVAGLEQVSGEPESLCGKCRRKMKKPKG